MGLRVAAAVVVLVGMTGTATGDRASETQAHVDKGLRRYNTQDYEGAIKEWREAYVLTPSTDTLFAIGQAQRLMGDCKAALVTYKTVLREPVSKQQTAEVTKVIEVCEKKLAEEPPPVAPVPTQSVTPPPPPPPPPPETPVTAHKPWFKDPLGITLLVLGTGGVAVGGTFFMMGRTAEQDADAATSYEQYSDAADLAKRDRNIALVGGAAGGALLVAAIIRFATRSDTVEVNASGSSGGASVSFAGRF